MIADNSDNSNTYVINEGNFKETFRFRIDAGDKTLKNHLKTTHAKATYISNTIQKEIIEYCKKEKLSKTLTNIKSNKFLACLSKQSILQIFSNGLVLR